MLLYGGFKIVLIKYPSGDQQGWALCPWCRKSRMVTDGLADVNVSISCSVCKNFYTVNLSTLKAKKTKAAAVRHKIQSFKKPNIDEQVITE